MGMRWYVLQVLTGQELAVRAALQRERILAKVPHGEFPARKGGQWRYIDKVLFPGYVFLGCEQLDNDLYYLAGHIDGVIRFLGAVRPEPITYAEAEQLALLAPNNEPLLPSTIKIEGDKVVITSGILQEFGPAIIKIERRRRRAKVLVHFLGEKKELGFALKPEVENDAAEATGGVQAH